MKHDHGIFETIQNKKIANLLQISNKPISVYSLFQMKSKQNYLRSVFVANVDTTVLTLESEVWAASVSFRFVVLLDWSILGSMSSIIIAYESNRKRERTFECEILVHKRSLFGEQSYSQCLVSQGFENLEKWKWKNQNWMSAWIFWMWRESEW